MSIPGGGSVGKPRRRHAAQGAIGRRAAGGQHQPGGQGQQGQPRAGHQQHREPRPHGRAGVGLPGPRPAVGQHLPRDQPHRQGDAQGHQQQVVELSQHGDEIRDEIDRAQGVGRHQRGQGLGVPGSARVTVGQQQGVDLDLQLPDPGAPGFQLSNGASSCEPSQKGLLAARPQRHSVQCSRDWGLLPWSSTSRMPPSRR